MVEYDIKKFVKILEKIKNTYSSLNEMARQSNVTSSYLSKIMAFKYEEPPSPKILKNIAKNSHNIISYMDLMYVCGYIDNKDIFEYYNKIFTKNNIINAVKKSEIFDIEDIEKIEYSTIYNFSNKINEISEEKQERFFSEIDKKQNSTHNNILQKGKRNIIEDSKKIPIVEDIKQNIIVIKNNKVKLNYKEEDIKHFVFFSNDYIKKEYDYVCIEVKDNSMNLKFNKADIILVQLKDTLKQGEIGIVSVNNEQFIRRYRKENEYIFLESLSNNENYITEIYNTKKDKIKILGKVIAYQGKI